MESGQIFSVLCRKYYELSIPVIPLAPRGKHPIIKDWSRFCRVLPTGQEMTEWESSFPTGNIGLPLGAASRIVGVDIDTDDPILLERIKKILPTSLVRKRGAKGETAFFRYAGHTSRKFRLHPQGKPIVELLSDGNQTVLPGSIHPETGRAYVWITQDTLLNLNASELQELPIDFIDQLEHCFSDLKSTVLESGKSGGRNDVLKNQVVAAVLKGKPDEEITREILRFDLQSHSPPLFSDQSDQQMRNRTPHENAARFVSNVRKSLIRSGVAQNQDASEISFKALALPQWPSPLGEEAYYGLAGEVVRAIEPNTEADSVALLIQLLTAFGNAVGRKAHFPVEADAHYLNLFSVLVGESSKGRKGTSWGHILRLFEQVDPNWRKECIKSGLASGEGLMWAVRDERKEWREDKDGGPEERIVDPGVSDKRLCDVETELASVLRAVERDGNKLSAVIRDSWDHGNLSSLTKSNASKASNAHISIIGHITRPELLRYLTETESVNGFANRFLWLCVKRSKLLPEGGDTVDISTFVVRLQEALRFGGSCSALSFDAEARAMWRVLYMKLSEGKPGLYGAVTARAEPQILRLASLYAVLNCSTTIRPPHLLAATAIWDYCDASCRYIFGEKTGDPTADRILEELRVKPKGLTQTEISEVFGRHKSSYALAQAFQSLVKAGLVRSAQQQEGDGRPVTRWFAITDISDLEVEQSMLGQGVNSHNSLISHPLEGDHS